MSSPTLAGNWNDDDGQVIDSLLDENTDGADKIRENATVPFKPAGETPKATTRIVGGTVTLAPGDPVFQALIGDTDRHTVHLHFLTVADADDQCRYSHDPGVLPVSGQQAPAFVAAQPIDGMLHTGPVYLYAPASNTAPITISYSGVTI